MRAFTIKVTKCGECPYVDPMDDTRPGSCCYLTEGGWTAYRQNKYGITPSCPMWPQSVEVEE